MVLNFRIDHVWLQGKIRISLSMTCLISGVKALLLMTKIYLILIKFQMRLQLDNRRNNLSKAIKNVHNTYVDFKIHCREEVMNMKKLELFLILFPVDDLKQVLIPETNKILKHPM